MKLLPSNRLPLLRSHVLAATFVGGLPGTLLLAVTLLLAGTLLLSAGTASAQQCTAAPGGPPCESGFGVASLGEPEGSDVTVGNPIHPITGNKYQEEIDSSALPGYLGLEIRRHFNSSYISADSPWGRGWSMSYDTRVHRSGATLQIIQADGRRLIFAAPSSQAATSPVSGGVCAAVAPGQGQLFAESDGYRWVWPQERELRFDASGRLVRIGPPGAGALESVNIERDDSGKVRRVTDPAGRSMRFDYDENGYLASIDHPLGRWRYRIDASGHVQSATAPDQVVRSYRYADPGYPGRFTAITVTSPGVPEKVIGEWAYDAQGRAERYRRADGSELRIAYEQGQSMPVEGPAAADSSTTRSSRSRQRQTVQKQAAQRQGLQLESSPHRTAPDRPALRQTASVLTNALGARTYFKAVEIAGKWRITEITGPGCAECGPSNIRMHYDNHGMLVAKSSLAGVGVAYERDRAGRVVVLRPLGLGQETTYLRFGYPDDHTFLPRLVARPSVVPGKEYRIEVDRDDRGNVVKLLQVGYAPAAKGDAVAEATRIDRSWRLHYRQIGGRRVLVELDGPLPNGPVGDPADSDITRWRYDEEGRFVTAVERPGMDVQRFESRDSAGRPLTVVSADGYRELEERRTYDVRSNVVVSETSARFVDGRPDAGSATPLRVSFDHDLQGRRVRSVDPAGRVVHSRYDESGRFVGVGDDRGFRSALTRDAEGRVAVAALHVPGVDAALRAAYHGRDPEGRLQAILLADGRHYEFHRGGHGEVVAAGGSDGRLHVATPASAPASTPASAGTERLDDFGQLLEQVLPDHGASKWRYDEAGRVVEVVDATGVRTGYRYDAAGRLVARLGDGGARDVSYTYQGRLLTEVDDPMQVVRYRRDARGRVIQTTTVLRGLSGPPLEVSTTYDPGTGLASSQSLAGGQSLQILRRSARDGATPRQLNLRSAFWARFLDRFRRWMPGGLADRIENLLPVEAVASEIDVHPFDGLAGFVHHNGVAFNRRFDPVGRTTRRSVVNAGGVVAEWAYTYGTGPRIRSVEQRPPAATGTVVRQVLAYHASGALKSVTDGATGEVVAFAGPTASRKNAGKAMGQAVGQSVGQAVGQSVVLDHAGRVVADGRFRYSYSRQGQLADVRHLADDRLVATYGYNYLGQRVRKTVLGGAHQPASTTYFLWNEQRLVAELDPDGSVVTQYLSLHDGQRDVPIASLRRRRTVGGGFELAAVHTDHRGAPVALTGERGQVVWRADVGAFGSADVHQPPRSAELPWQMRPLALNLRLPGQYWDEETGLHDNWHRTYDPASGRYLQPDPLGYPDGPDAYAYAGGDPVNRIDPRGLYEIDVHYYMTFFLGVTAGLNPEDARVVALASQYVDDNPLTRPLDETHLGTTVGSLLRNQRQLLGYHFVLSGTDGRTLPEYRSSRLNNPDSPQLLSLLAASRSTGISRNASLQFLGEYLHALADTYSHRDSADRPYDALIAGCGLGHGHDLHEPDLTYDDPGSLARGADEGQPSGRQPWMREARTLEMEAALHGVLQSYGQPDKAKGFAEIEAVLREFNSIRERQSSGKASDFSQKIALLEARLAALGLQGINMVDQTSFGYEEDEARRNRLALLRNPATRAPLREEDFPGVCLEGGSRCVKD